MQIRFVIAPELQEMCWIYIYIYIYMCVCVCLCAVKRLIMINHIQNKSFRLHNICVLCIFIMYILYTHTCMYIFKKKSYVYILNIFNYNINDMNINIYM